MLFARPPTVAVRPVIPVWLVTVVPKPDDADTSMLYDAAPVTAPQLTFSDVGWFTEPLDGDASTGTPGVAMIVVKLHAPDHALVPPMFVAFTSQ